MQRSAGFLRWQLLQFLVLGPGFYQDGVERERVRAILGL
jgi:hypothetical protein